MANLVGWPLLAPSLGRPPIEALALGFVLPLAIAHWLIGMTTYFQHTGESIAWHREPGERTFFAAQVEGTHRLAAHGWLRSVITGARPHSAHHVDMQVPAIHLRAAQASIDAAFPGAVPTFAMGLRSILDTTTRCKLYDYDRHRWTDFSGQPSPGRAPGPHA